MLHSDAFNNARTVVEDMHERDLGSFDRALMVSALVEAGQAAEQEVRGLRESRGVLSASGREFCVGRKLPR